MKCSFNGDKIYIETCDDKQTEAYFGFCNRKNNSCVHCLGLKEDKYLGDDKTKIKISVFKSGKVLLLFKEKDDY